VRPLLLIFGILALAVPPTAEAQRAAGRGARLEVMPLPANSPPAGAVVIADRLLGGAKLRELIRSGFPAALSFRLDLWRVGGMFDELEGSRQWNVLVRYDPYSQEYLAVRRQGTLLEDFGGYPSLEEAEAALAKPFEVILRPREAGSRYYYNVVVDIEALSVSDLDELERWLRGELRPAVRGKRAPLPALQRGIGTLLSRVLGGERRQFEAKSATFRI
jgi:hypothetical protein